MARSQATRTQDAERRERKRAERQATLRSWFEHVYGACDQLSLYRVRVQGADACLYTTTLNEAKKSITRTHKPADGCLLVIEDTRGTVLRYRREKGVWQEMSFDEW